MSIASGSGSKPLREVEAGFIPLVDCAPLVIAHELGFARKMGCALRLHREVSWANIRDKVDVGVLDCAHMLAPMPIAATLGLGRAAAPVIAPMAMSLNGNAITVSLPLLDEMRAADAAALGAGGMRAAGSLALVVERRRREGGQPLTLGMVYPFSAHNYDLRYWLAAAGIDPDNDVNLVVVPPPLLVDSLKSGRVDGFCVGEPWNSVAAAQGLGAIVTTKSELWAMSPEKVLGVSERWALRNPDTLAALVAALVMAGAWLDEPENRKEAAHILSRPAYVGVPEELLLHALTGRLLAPGGGERTVRDMIVFHREQATFPWRSHALWFLTQMLRWGQLRVPVNLEATAARVYRPDIYREAVAELGVKLPAMDKKLEDGADFFGGDEFDPAKPLAYLSKFKIQAQVTDFAALAELNA